MADVIFTSPEDGGNTDAVLADILGLMRERGEDYWNCPDGSGFAGLSYFPEGNGNEPGMIAGLDFTRINRLGFHFFYRYECADLHSPYYREPEYFCSFAGVPLTKRSRVGWAGEGRLIFDALFVDLSTAEAVVREFISTGGRAPTVGWIGAGEVRRAEAVLEE